MLQATATPLEDHRVRLSIEVDPAEFTEAFEAAVQEVSSSIRLPGFRPGRVPRKLVESRIGKEALREEAIRDALPGYVRRAATETGTDAIGTPDIEVTSSADDPELRFDAVVQIRPRPSIAGYAGLRVTVPSPVASEEEVDRQVDRMREQFGELQVVSRPARDGDHLTVDLKAHRHSEVVADLTVDDFVYELGSDGLVDALDEQLRSAKSGDIFKFNTTHRQSGDELTMSVLVKEVKEKVLPVADDAWAAEASEFATLAELRDDIARQIGDVKKVKTRLELRSEVARELTALVTDDPPEILVAEEMQARFNDLQRRLAAQGVSVADYLSATGQDASTFTEGLRSGAEMTVKLDLALRSLAEAESIEIDEAEISERIADVAARSGTDASTLRNRLEEVGGMDSLTWDLRKSKALEWLVDNVEVVDEEGNAVDREALSPSPEESGLPADPDADNLGS